MPHITSPHTLQHVTEISSLESVRAASLPEFEHESGRSAGEHVTVLRNFFIYCNACFWIIVSLKNKNTL